MRTRMDLEVGDIVCDMHYGLPKAHRNLYSLETRSHVSFDLLAGDEDCGFFRRMLLSVGLEDPIIQNKMAYVVGFGANGWYKAAYRYDGRRFGMFEFRETR